MTQNQIAYHNAKELARHNVATEKENVRHQKVQELIQKRSNELQAESNTITREHYERMDAINASHYQNLDAYNFAMLQESQRANTASEGIRAEQNAINAAANAELARHQRAQEGIDYGLLQNTIYKTQADVSYTSANAEYTRNKAAQVWHQNALYDAQTNTETYRAGSLHSDILTGTYNRQYIGEQTRNLQSQRWLNYSGMVHNYATSAQALSQSWRNVIEGKTSILKLVTAGAGAGH